MHKRSVIILVTIFTLTVSIITGFFLFESSLKRQNITQNPETQEQIQLTMSAAASLKEAIAEIEPLLGMGDRQAQSRISIRYNFASSGALQQQIESGAPVDIFFSAAAKQMDALQSKNLILTHTRRNLLGNRLVVIVPTGTKNIRELKDLMNAEIERIAIANPQSVPAGEYAEQSLKKLNIWERIQSKLVLGNNVRQVLQFVESGNAQAGIVYFTDAKTTKQVEIVEQIDPKLHAPILYPIAVLSRSSKRDAAIAYIKSLTEARAKHVFEKYGFDLL
jgi:molybdate transport system substrate-binding protein